MLKRELLDKLVAWEAELRETVSARVSCCMAPAVAWPHSIDSKNGIIRHVGL